jgi:hypothetical protein
MSIASIARSSFIVFGIVSSSALAFARQPPALVQAQQRADSAACEGTFVVAGSGYRDMGVRFADQRAAPAKSVAVRTGAGYRDATARFGDKDATQVAACEGRSRL